MPVPSVGLSHIFPHKVLTVISAIQISTAIGILMILLQMPVSVTELRPDVSFTSISHAVFYTFMVGTKWENLSCITIMPNLHPNEDELTIRVYLSDHYWSFMVILAMTMTIKSNCVLLVRVASAGRYKSFEHVQNVRVPSANNFHSRLKHVVIIFVTQLTCCILVILTVYYVIRACNVSDERSANVTR